MNIEDMESQVGTPSDAAKLAAGLGSFTETIATIAQALNGYRLTLIEQGWSPPVAEQLAGHLLAHWNGEFCRMMQRAGQAVAGESPIDHAIRQYSGLAASGEPPVEGER